MTEFTEDEMMLIRIYYESKKDWLIGNLMTMLSETTADETELRQTTEGLIRKLSTMSATEFREIIQDIS